MTKHVGFILALSFSASATRANARQRAGFAPSVAQPEDWRGHHALRQCRMSEHRQSEPRARHGRTISLPSPRGLAARGARSKARLRADGRSRRTERALSWRLDPASRATRANCGCGRETVASDARRFRRIDDHRRCWVRGSRLRSNAGPRRIVQHPRLLDTTATPSYPPMLLSHRVDGEVLAQFVVDTLGRAEMSSFKVLKTTHVLFANSVRGLLPSLRFAPAEVSGGKVRQLLQLPFTFRLPP